MKYFDLLWWKSPGTKHEHERARSHLNYSCYAYAQSEAKLRGLFHWKQQLLAFECWQYINRKRELLSPLFVLFKLLNSSYVQKCIFKRSYPHCRFLFHTESSKEYLLSWSHCNIYVFPFTVKNGRTSRYCLEAYPQCFIFCPLPSCLFVLFGQFRHQFLHVYWLIYLWGGDPGSSAPWLIYFLVRMHTPSSCITGDYWTFKRSYLLLLLLLLLLLFRRSFKSFLNWGLNDTPCYPPWTFSIIPSHGPLVVEFTYNIAQWLADS